MELECAFQSAKSPKYVILVEERLRFPKGPLSKSQGLKEGMIDFYDGMRQIERASFIFLFLLITSLSV